MNVSFAGDLYLKNVGAWTPKMIQAINDNKSLQKKLVDYDIIGDISTKKERNVPAYFANHKKGDTIYKVSFTVQEENPSIWTKLKKAFKSKTYIINRHYHSETTTVDRINKLEIE